MAARSGPTLRARLLGRRLRELREAAGLTLRDAGDYLVRDASSVSRMEAGHVPARVADVLALLSLYGVDDECRRRRMESLARDVWHRGWWDDFAPEDAALADHAWLEARARAIRTFDTYTVPELLQTRAYAEAVVSAATAELSQAQRSRLVEFWMRRRAVLDQDDAPALAAVVDEGALRRLVGGRAVMAAQLARLAEQAERDDIELRVLPFEAGVHPGAPGRFQVFESVDPYLRLAHVHGDAYLDGEEADRLARAHDALRELALPPRESLTRIAILAKEL